MLKHRPDNPDGVAAESFAELALVHLRGVHRDVFLDGAVRLSRRKGIGLPPTRGAKTAEGKQTPGVKPRSAKSGLHHFAPKGRALINLRRGRP